MIRLNHIGLNIRDEGDIENFYKEILGFETEYRMEVRSELSRQLFNISRTTESVLMRRGDLLLELFVYPQTELFGYIHICIETDERDEIASKCKERGYPMERITRRDKYDLIFIKDHSGNVFELRNRTK